MKFTYTEHQISHAQVVTAIGLCVHVTHIPV